MFFRFTFCFLIALSSIQSRSADQKIVTVEDQKTIVQAIAQLPCDLQVKIFSQYIDIFSQYREVKTYPEKSMHDSTISLFSTKGCSSVDSLLRPWIDARDAGPQISIKRGTIGECVYTLNVDEPKNILFTGYNKNNFGCVVFNTAEQSSVVVLDPYCLPERKSFIASLWGTEIGSEYHKSSGFGSLIDGVVTALILHEQENRIAYVVYNYATGKPQLRIGELAIKNPKEGYLALLSTVTDFAILELSFGCKKLVHFGEQSYGLVTTCGQFKFAEQQDKQIQIYDQQHGALRFKNIAVNRERTDIKNGTLRCALLTKEGELFIADLWTFKKPTLLYAQNVPDHEYVQNIYYEDDEFKIAYHDVENPQLITKVDVYQDNYIFHWVRAFTRQYQKELAQQ
jgi:hypothetical protein